MGDSDIHTWSDMSKLQMAVFLLIFKVVTCVLNIYRQNNIFGVATMIQSFLILK